MNLLTVTFNCCPTTVKNNPLITICTLPTTNSLSGFVQCGICGPMELAKIKLQAQGEGKKAGTRGTYSGTVACLQKIYKYEGFRGLCRGMYL